MTPCSPGPSHSYDYLLKFLLVGDSDVGKNEILNLLDEERVEGSFANGQGLQIVCLTIELPAEKKFIAVCAKHNHWRMPFFCKKYGDDVEQVQHRLWQVVSPKTTTILLEGKKVKLQLWDTSGQGRFSTILRSYSRGAQGVLVVYDITNRWSFDGIARWLREIEEQAPGIPKILIGNRLHLEFRRQISRNYAEHFAGKRNMEYFEVSPLASFNIRESLTELSRLVLMRNGMERLWKSSKVLSLQELCSRCIVRHLSTVHDIERLSLPPSVQLHLISFADSAQLTAVNTLRRHKRNGSEGHSAHFAQLNTVLASPLVNKLVSRCYRRRDDRLSREVRSLSPTTRQLQRPATGGAGGGNLLRSSSFGPNQHRSCHLM